MGELRGHSVLLFAKPLAFSADVACIVEGPISTLPEFLFETVWVSPVEAEMPFGRVPAIEE